MLAAVYFWVSATIKDHLEDFDDSDAKTVITSKSFRGLNIRKKDRRKIKHHLFKQRAMVKPKRVTARQKIERKAEKSVPSTKKDDDLATIISTAKSTPWDVRSRTFKDVDVGSAIIKDRLEDFDDSDAKTVITSKSFRGLNIRKKDRRKIKHHLFKQKINLIKEAKEALKAKKKREKTVVTGDLQPIANSLPTVKPSIEQYIVNSTAHNSNQKDSSDRKKYGQKHRKKQQLTDIDIFKQVQQHVEYKTNPTATIQEHLENRIVLENQTMDTS